MLVGLVGRTQTAEFWIRFKLLGFFPLTIILAIAQTGLMKRHAASTDSPET